jgi:glycosyltransferase involved in cell wall biosynthesis
VGLINLYKQIEPVLCEAVTWTIKDSGACVLTGEWGKTLNNSNIKFITGLDDGIYNALNIALEECKSDFYLVVGADDSINSISIIEIKRLLLSGALEYIDIASFPILIQGAVFIKKRFYPTFISISGLISSHSVGTLIRRSLHDYIGLYNERYKILADALFIRKAYQYGAKFGYYKYPVIGTFSTSGISSTEHANRILEAYSYNVACGDSKLLQAILMFLRVIKFRPTSFF